MSSSRAHHFLAGTWPFRAFLLALGTVGLGVPQVIAQDTLHDDVLVLLARADDEGTQPISRELARLGGPAVPALVDVLVYGKPSVSPMAREAALEGLTRIGASRVVPFLEDSIDEHAAESSRRVGLEILEYVGEGRHIALALSLAQGEPALPDPLGAAASGVLRRRPRDVHYVARFAHEAEPECLHALAGALVAEAGPQAVEELADILQFRSDAAASLLSQLGLAAERWPMAVNAATRATARGFLGDDRRHVAQAAADCLGRLEDPEALPILLGWLEGTDDERSTAAYWAIRRISGMSFRRDPRRWSTWLEEEHAWRAEGFDDALSRLESHDRLQVALALEELREHPLYRDEVAPSVARVLKDVDPLLRARACSVLSSLRSPGALGALAGCLDDDATEVRATAVAGLRAITGWQLPMNRRAWEKALANPVRESPLTTSRIHRVQR